MSYSLSQKRTEDLLTDCPKLAKQVQDQKLFLATSTEALSAKIQETKISAAALLITPMAHQPLPLPWLNALSPSAIPFSLKLHKILDGPHNNHPTKLHRNPMIGWGSCGCHHAALPTVTFSFSLRAFLHTHYCVGNSGNRGNINSLTNATELVFPLQLI